MGPGRGIRVPGGASGCRAGHPDAGQGIRVPGGRTARHPGSGLLAARRDGEDVRTAWPRNGTVSALAGARRASYLMPSELQSDL